VIPVLALFVEIAVISAEVIVLVSPAIASSPVEPITILTLAVFAVIAVAWAEVIPVFAVLFVIAVAWALVIVVVLPALAVDAVVPIARLEVPAPIRLRTSAALIPEFSDGVVPLESIAGVPESVTLAVLAVMADAWLDVMPVLAVLAVIALA
jgi:hypothetical protein